MAAPRSANIEVTIGNINCIVDYKNFSSLSIKRTAKDACDSFTLNVLDDAAFTIEKALLSGNSNSIKIVYIDDNIKEGKKLEGFILSESSSFVDNRCMLSLKGYVSVSIRSKFETYSFSWNSVPRFDWAKVLGVANRNVKDANYDDDGGWDKFTENAGVFFKNFGGAFKSLFQWNWSNWADYDEVIDRIFNYDWISIDASGNYYITKYIDKKNDEEEHESVMDNNAMTASEEEDKVVQSEGSYVIPIAPHKIIKLICCGGNFSDLLEDEYSDYKGTAFYDDDISEAEWYFIKKWYEKMGRFDGLGYSEFVIDEETDRIEDEFIQTRKSFLDFIYNDLLPKCRKTKGNEKYTNFYISFEGRRATLKRLDVSKAAANAPEYIYYGQFQDTGENKGRMTSFSPTLDILTSLIAAGSDAGVSADISHKNLITGGENEGVTVNASNVSTEGRYNVTWGVVKVSTAYKDSANKDNAETSIASIWNKASALPYQAEATITGYNNLSPQDYIKITILPSNETGARVVHHMSGTYFILSIEDEISNGMYTSRLSLIKNVNKIGLTATISEDEAKLKYSIVTGASGGGGGSSFGSGSGGGPR